MTIQAQVSVQVFNPGDYHIFQIFIGLDVDQHSIAVTFSNMRQKKTRGIKRW